MIYFDTSFKYFDESLNEISLSDLYMKDPLDGPYKSELNVDTSTVLHLIDIKEYLEKEKSIKIKFEYITEYKEYHFEVKDMKNDKIIYGGVRSGLYINFLKSCVDKAVDYVAKNNL